MAKKIDPKAKAKRQKIYAGVGGVILLAVLAFQVPRTLKMMHPAIRASSSPAPATTTAARRRRRSARPRWPAATPPPRRPRPRPEATASATPMRFRLPQSGQLLAFGLFRSKDPFVQQLNLNGATGATGVVPSSGSAGATGPTGAASGRLGRLAAVASPPVSAPPRRRAARDHRSDLGERRLPSPSRWAAPSRRESLLQARLGDEEGREDLDRRRLARERRADGHADQEQGA